MRATTRVWALCESVGKPKMSLKVEGETVESFTIQFARWLYRVNMGSKLRITICRSGAELEAATRNPIGAKTGDISDMEAILRGIAAQPGLGLDDEFDDEPELLDFDDEIED